MKLSPIMSMEAISDMADDAIEVAFNVSMVLPESKDGKDSLALVAAILTSRMLSSLYTREEVEAAWRIAGVAIARLDRHKESK